MKHDRISSISSMRFLIGALVIFIVIPGLLLGHLAMIRENYEGPFLTQHEPTLWTRFEDASKGIGLPRADGDKIRKEDKLIDWPDKLSDVEEVNEYGTDPSNPDSDGDGMEDGWEINHRIWDPDSMRWTLDPLVNDAFENPDGDGYDADHDGIISDEEALFNLREYCGGAVFDFTRNCFDQSDPIFGGLSPVHNSTEIAMLGGYHLYDDPADGRSGSLSIPDLDTFDDYLRYDPVNDLPVTTHPSRHDTDGDGMDDGWEVHFQSEARGLYFDENGTFIVTSIDELSQEEKLVSGITHEDGSYPFFFYHLSRIALMDPLHPGDADLDMDIQKVLHFSGEGKLIIVFRPDGLSNIKEFENGTSPLLWDTDGDSFFDAMEGRFFDLSDKVEIESCIIDYW
jgi:hypothetical protein